MSRPSAPDLAERIAGLSPAQRARLEQRLRERGAEMLRTESIPRRAERGTAPLSFAQRRLWFLDQLVPGNPAYTESGAYRLQGVLDRDALGRALEAIVARHEALRTTFAVMDGRPVQVIAADQRVELPVADISGGGRAEREKRAEEWIAENVRRPFDLARGPLLRAGLLRLDEQEHVLLLTMHHIVSDGWSMGVFIQELARFYEEFSGGRPAALPEPPIQYADFAVWQREWLSGEVLEQQLSYWRKQLAGLPVLELPTDRPRPPIQSFRGAAHSILFSKSLTEGLRELSRREGATLFMTLLAAFQVLLTRYTGQEDVVVGSPIAGRTEVETEGLIGFFVNTLVLRGDLSGEPPFHEFLRRVRETALGAYAHQDLPFEKLVEELKPERDLGQNPLFEVSFGLENVPAPSFELTGLEVIPLPTDSRTTHFDLEVHIREKPGGLTCTFVCATDLFDPGTIVRMIGHYQTLLEGIVTDANQRVSELAILTAAERRQLLVDWNDTEVDYPRDLCVHHLFEAQVERSPDAVAVVFGDESLTYGELNCRANRLARRLRKMGVGPEALVGLCLERSLEMVVGLLGILKAGGAYVPLDPVYPKERLGFMLKDTGAQVVLTQESLWESLPEGQFERVRLDADWGEIEQESDENPESHAISENLAYVIYTSGSTGTPKGVSIRHRSIVRLVRETNYATFGPGEVFLQFAPISFDASTFEVWGALVNGARLVVMPPGLPSLAELGAAIKRHKVSTLWLTAGLFHQMVETQIDGVRGVRQLLAGGDVLSVPHVERVLRELPACRLINGYGPTENTTFTCCHTVRRDEPLGASVPIGRPIANTRVFILDHWRQPVPIGVPGELYIGGDGLARDYFRRPELTAQRFLPNPFGGEGEKRLYRTGDRARFRADGTIEFLGRFDDQVKIRGFRIEPGEVQAVLAAHPGVRESVVGAREDSSGERRLVAYVVPAPGALLSSHELRGWLRKQLPDYMVPSAFLFLDALPLTPNGKADRKALAALLEGGGSERVSAVPPRDDVERRLVHLWEEVLEIRPIGVQDNYFEIGGHSLAAVRLFAQIEKEFGRALPVSRLFETPTVEGLASALRSDGSRRPFSSLIAIRPGDSRPPVFLVHSGRGHVLIYLELASLLDREQPVYGLQALVANDGRPLHISIPEMAAHYLSEIRSVQPSGPYLLGGSSLGGNVAFEMARQLERAGEEVALVALFDSSVPSDSSVPTPEPTGPRTLSERARFHAGKLLALPPRERLSYVQGRSLALARRISRRLSGRVRDLPKERNPFEEAGKLVWRRHEPGAYGGRVTLFRATEPDGHAELSDSDLGWGGRCAGGVEIVDVSGGHITMFAHPHVRGLAERLNDCLERAGAQTLEALTKNPLGFRREEP